jgi:catechol 2,3-dioxygenase-like lactoylglutathione lyase family enzyme
MKNFFFLSGFLIATCSAFAQAQPVFDCVFNHMAFPVKNLQVSVDFYQRILNLKEITNRSGNPNIRWLSLGGERELHLISGVNEPVKVNKALHLAISTDNIYLLASHLKANNIQYSDWAGIPNTLNTRADGVKQIYFQDPDGYWIEVNNGYVGAKREQNVKDTIWKFEEDYWVYVKNKDFKNYLTLWDDQFKGYPSTNIIGGKANITDWITEMYAKNTGKVFDYSLTRMEENVFDDIVIVLYDATTFWRNAKGEMQGKTTFKLTHTWKKTPAGWKIIGGMGAIK